MNDLAESQLEEFKTIFDSNLVPKLGLLTTTINDISESRRKKWVPIYLESSSSSTICTELFLKILFFMPGLVSRILDSGNTTCLK